MEGNLKDIIISRASRIYAYKFNPQSDEKYLERKELYAKQYAEAQKNYTLTKAEIYKIKMKKIKMRDRYNISKTEYELCVKDLKNLREKYYNEVDAAFWNIINEMVGCK